MLQGCCSRQIVQCAEDNLNTPGTIYNNWPEMDNLNIQGTIHNNWPEIQLPVRYSLMDGLIN